MSAIEDALRRHPTLVKPLADMIEFMDAKKWGDFTLRFKFGRCVVYFKAESIEVTETRQSEERAPLTSNHREK